MGRQGAGVGRRGLLEAACGPAGTLLRGDSARDRAECLAFFREVSKVRQLGWDPVYLTLAPPGDPEPDSSLGQNPRSSDAEL